MPGVARPEVVLRLMETWVRRPTTPNRVVMSLTRRCNLRCVMCHTWELPAGHELTPAEIAATLGQLPRLTWLDLTGGEPFLRKDAEAVFDAVLDHAPALRVLHFPTNGWFERRILDVARRVRQRRPEVALVVTVSLDGPREVHDRVRGRDGAFDRALSTFRALRRLDDVEVYVGTTVTPESEPHLPALEATLRAELPDFRPSEWHWNWFQASEHFFGNGHLGAWTRAAPGDLVRQHLARRGLPRSAVDLMELGFLVNLDAYRRGEPTGITCQALRSTCFISPEGDVYPCHVYDRPLGNVRQTAFADLWAAPHVKEARADIERLACGGCFTPCEAYPALAGAPLAATTQTARRLVQLAGRWWRQRSTEGAP